MWLITKKEINDFFSSWIGYLILTVFLVIATLFIWFLDSQFNLIQAGFADLNVFFTLSPWLMIFLLPAICIKGFAIELKTGTLEILFTKPIKTWELVLGKFFGYFIITLFNLTPTIIYFVGIYSLKVETASIDIGSAFASYLGLFLLSSSFISISLFCSVLSNNQVASFLFSVFICFCLFFFGEFSDLISNPIVFDFVNNIGIKEHYFSMNQGILSVKDIAYFLALNYLFLYLSMVYLNKIKT